MLIIPVIPDTKGADAILNDWGRGAADKIPPLRPPVDTAQVRRDLDQTLAQFGRLSEKLAGIGKTTGIGELEADLNKARTAMARLEEEARQLQSVAGEGIDRSAIQAIGKAYRAAYQEATDAARKLAQAQREQQRQTTAETSLRKDIRESIAEVERLGQKIDQALDPASVSRVEAQLRETKARLKETGEEAKRLAAELKAAELSKAPREELERIQQKIKEVAQAQRQGLEDLNEGMQRLGQAQANRFFNDALVNKFQEAVEKTGQVVRQVGKELFGLTEEQADLAEAALDMGEAGSELGALFGPVGAIVGGALGLIAGAWAETSRQSEEASKKLREAEKNATAAATRLNNLAKVDLGDVASALETITKQAESAGQFTPALANALNSISTRALDAIAQSYRDIAIASAEAEAKATEAVFGDPRSIEELTKAYNDAVQAADELKQKNAEAAKAAAQEAEKLSLRVERFAAQLALGEDILGADQAKKLKDTYDRTLDAQKNLFDRQEQELAKAAKAQEDADAARVKAAQDLGSEIKERDRKEKESAETRKKNADEYARQVKDLTRDIKALGDAGRDAAAATIPDTRRRDVTFADIERARAGLEALAEEFNALERAQGETDRAFRARVATQLGLSAKATAEEFKAALEVRRSALEAQVDLLDDLEERRRTQGGELLRRFSAQEELRREATEDAAELQRGLAQVAEAGEAAISRFSTRLLAAWREGPEAFQDALTEALEFARLDDQLRQALSGGSLSEVIEAYRARVKELSPGEVLAEDITFGVDLAQDALDSFVTDSLGSIFTGLSRFGEQLGATFAEGTRGARTSGRELRKVVAEGELAISRELAKLAAKFASLALGAAAGGQFQSAALYGAAAVAAGGAALGLGFFGGRGQRRAELEEERERERQRATSPVGGGGGGGGGGLGRGDPGPQVRAPVIVQLNASVQTVVPLTPRQREEVGAKLVDLVNEGISVGKKLKGR